jgi:predicted TIM-barrel fold metal-dependent hydrolase
MMSDTVIERPTTAKTQIGVVDCDIHPTVTAMSDLHPYMTDRWKQHLKEFGANLRQQFASAGLYARYNRDGGARMDARPPNGVPSGADLPFMQEQHLDPNLVQYGVLQPLRPMGTGMRNHEFGESITAAVNQWQLGTWCGLENRLKGSLMLTREDPASALREIDRNGSNPNFVQFSVLPHGLEPLGRQRYWPIFEAAEALGKPIGVHVGGLSGFAPTSSGWCSYYVEEHHSKCEAMQALVTSMVIEGVFERFPKLRVVLIEGGFVWVPSLCWRLDKHWKHLKSEVPHLKRAPSEYVREHFWYTTQPVEEPVDPRHMLDAMDWVGWDKILFSTDYPHWDFDDPKFAFARLRLTPEQQAILFRDNAKRLYGLQ